MFCFFLSPAMYCVKLFPPIDPSSFVYIIFGFLPIFLSASMVAVITLQECPFLFQLEEQQHTYSKHLLQLILLRHVR